MTLIYIIYIDYMRKGCVNRIDIKIVHTIIFLLLTTLMFLVFESCIVTTAWYSIIVYNFMLLAKSKSYVIYRYGSAIKVFIFWSSCKECAKILLLLLLLQGNPSHPHSSLIFNIRFRKWLWLMTGSACALLHQEQYRCVNAIMTTINTDTSLRTYTNHDKY